MTPKQTGSSDCVCDFEINIEFGLNSNRNKLSERRCYARNCMSQTQQKLWTLIFEMQKWHKDVSIINMLNFDTVAWA